MMRSDEEVEVVNDAGELIKRMHISYLPSEPQHHPSFSPLHSLTYSLFFSPALFDLLPLSACTSCAALFPSINSAYALYLGPLAMMKLSTEVSIRGNGWSGWEFWLRIKEWEVGVG
ncbi:DNA-protecting protein DprA [Sesbania bispinosa]|nr:DNA-protecting protein DprA [Sesbania bispinosa]